MWKLKIAPTVKIAGIVYSVRMVSQMSTEDNCTGKIRTGRAIIDLDNDMHPDMAKATILHEIIEAIDIENELSLEHHKVQSLATQLYQVINDNPEIFKND